MEVDEMFLDIVLVLVCVAAVSTVVGDIPVADAMLKTLQYVK